MSKPRNWRLIALAAAVAIAVAGGVGWLALRPAPTAYVTAPVTRGDVSTTISASGTVNPVVTVAVGTYVSGTITTLSCDYNTQVRKGQLCAKIDPAPYAVVVEEVQADLANAGAQLVKDQANAAYTQAALRRQTLLLSENSTSHDAADIALDANHQAAALVGVDQAIVRQKAAVLKAALINLGYTNIVSPVDGTVVSRNVTAGQTVAASFSTPTLFLIARDLTKMQVDTSVSESDIAGAVQGAGASFSVDAFPNQVFPGIVAQVRQSPISVQNVITYDVVINVENARLLLKPGMTATVRIVRDRASNVLRIPSQALRFTPEGKAKSARPSVWTQRGGKLVQVSVKPGLDDGTHVEIGSGDLTVGDRVITGLAAPKANSKAGKAAATPSLRV